MSGVRGIIPFEGECEGCGKELSRPLPRSKIGNIYNPIRVRCANPDCREVNHLKAGTEDEV